MNRMRWITSVAAFASRTKVMYGCRCWSVILNFSNWLLLSSPSRQYNWPRTSSSMTPGPSLTIHCRITSRFLLLFLWFPSVGRSTTRPSSRSMCVQSKLPKSSVIERCWRASLAASRALASRLSASMVMRFRFVWVDVRYEIWAEILWCIKDE
jgi:hypothetical protein